jgi:hypothetical protein
MKKSTLFVAILTAGLGAAGAVGVSNLVDRPAQAPAAPVSQGQPGWQAPSPQFLSDWDSYRALQAEILKEQVRLQASGAVKHYQADLDRANGVITRLQQSVPNGFSFDQDKRFFIPAPKPAPADPALGAAAKPPAAAVPAPAPKVK